MTFDQLNKFMRRSNGTGEPTVLSVIFRSSLRRLSRASTQGESSSSECLRCQRESASAELCPKAFARYWHGNHDLPQVQILRLMDCLCDRSGAYPEGDPRATVLLLGIAPSDEMQDLARCVFELTGLHPNCDFALAAMVDALGLPADAPFKIFLIGRTVGWCAHVIEQNRDGTLIRPRGRYVDATPS